MIDYSDIKILEVIETSETTIISTDYSSLTGTYLDLISSNLIYQLSTENMRKAIGGFFYIRDETDEYNKLVFSANILDVNEEDDIRGLDMKYVSPLSNKVSKIEANSAAVVSIDDSFALPNLKIPFRMYADQTEVSGDVYWREYFTGGSYGSANFKNLYDVEKIYYDIAISLKTPIDYKVLRAYEYLNIDPGEDLSIYEIKSQYKDYNHLVQNYQDWSSDLESELLIPNYNIIVDKFVSLARALDVTADEVDEINREYRIGQTDGYDSVMAYNMIPGVNIIETEKDQYYGSFFVNYPHSNESKQNVIRNQQNIMFSSEYFRHYYTDFGEDTEIESADTLSEKLSLAGIEIDKHASTFYNAQINFTRHKLAAGGADAVEKVRYDKLKLDSIAQPTMRSLGSLLTPEPAAPGGTGSGGTNDISALSAKLLEILKDIDEGAITDVPIRNQSFGYANNFMSVVSESGLPSSIQNGADLPIDTIALKSINYLQLLTYIYNNYDVAINDNYIFMGPQKPEYASTIAKDTLYKNKISQDVLTNIGYSVKRLEDYFKDLMATISSEGIVSVGDVTFRQEQIFKKILSPTKKLYEVMAYKIEKIGGAATGDSSTQNVIQKFWVYNDGNAPDTINITDSQVKYGEAYTYRISAYALVMSHKYKYADYRLTKQIGSGQKFNPDDVTEDPKFCLQFYNPATNERASQIFTKTSPDDDTYAAFVDYATSAFAESEFAVDQIDVSLSPQVADFNLYIEPCLELIEIPFAKKIINIMDSPPNAINITPFHFIDNTDRLGFKIGQDSFVKRPYPELITDADQLTKAKYLRSREMASYQNIFEPSQSPARYVEMFRINKKPNAFTDFRNGLVSTIDLRIEDSTYNYLDYITADQVIPNKKYYYVFRLLNENMVPGPLSQIIEAQLTSDGGYVYSTFDNIDSSEFNPNKIETKTKNAKKIFQLEPHVLQMMFNTDGADFGNTASEEIDNIKVGVAEQRIWDSKRFKIRLTSTKTGRKLDLNTGFNLRKKDITHSSEKIIIPDSVDDKFPAPPLDPPPSEDDISRPPAPTLPPPTISLIASEYAIQAESGNVLYRSQVNFINNGGAGGKSIWFTINRIMSSMGYSEPASSFDRKDIKKLMHELAKYIFVYKDVPSAPMDNLMFVEHLAMLLTEQNDAGERSAWVGPFFKLEGAVRPKYLRYLDPSLLGEASSADAINSLLIEGLEMAGATLL